MEALTNGVTRCYRQSATSTRKHLKWTIPPGALEMAKSSSGVCQRITCVVLLCDASATHESYTFIGTRSYCLGHTVVRPSLGHKFELGYWMASDLDSRTGSRASCCEVQSPCTRSWVQVSSNTQGLCGTERGPSALEEALSQNAFAGHPRDVRVHNVSTNHTNVGTRFTLKDSYSKK